ncbi:MAG: HDIG domain-containing protein [Desulfobacterales bacterium]|nr:HDIG domain-containing protein [Desulfobacterales bacterium]
MVTEKDKELIGKFLGSSNFIRWGLLFAVTLIFTILLYPDLVLIKYSYKVGDISERDIKSPKDFFVQDIEKTEATRKQVLDAVLSVYDYNPTLSSSVIQNIQKAFSDLRALINAGKKPERTALPQKPAEGADSVVKDKLSLHDKIWQMKEAFETKLGISVSKEEYQILEKNDFSQAIADFICIILKDIFDTGVVTNKEILLRQTEKGIILRAIDTKEEKPATSLRPLYGHDQAKRMVRIIAQPILKDIHYTVKDLIVDISTRLIQPNITLNQSETEERKKHAASKVTPALFKIKAGEMLLREGERVTEDHLLKLAAMQDRINTKQILSSSMGVAMIILCLLIITYILRLRSIGATSAYHNKDLFFLASVLTTFFVLVKIFPSFSGSLTSSTFFSLSDASIYFIMPVASAAMIICLFLGFEISLFFSVVLAICTAIILQNRFEIFIYFLLSNTMAAYWMQRCKERKVFIKAGLKLGLLNVVLAASLNMYMAHLSGKILFWDCSFAFLGGVLAGVLTAGLAPLVEVAFGYTTDISLLELANHDQPILHRLMIEAPGTYHHSVIVGSLVEAAAAEIGANPLLAKVCGYYHDIGKINKPLYFIENQTIGKNKHDKLAPSMSSLILIAHVKDGAKIAKENKLGQAIIDTISQHHGTSLIRYFYEKAKQLKGEDAINIDEFRYPGAKPQTKEAGLVMLADIVEAASRTLENPTPARLQGLVQNLVNKAFSDGQLDNCELTLKDLHRIARSFNNILHGIHHHRIEYYENQTLSNGKGKNGSPDRQPAKLVQNLSGKNPEKSPGSLRRLGLS